MTDASGVNIEISEICQIDTSDLNEVQPIFAAGWQPIQVQMGGKSGRGEGHPITI